MNTRKLFVLSIVFVLALSGCVGGILGPSDSNAVQPTYTALPTYTAYPTFTAVVTETAQPTESATPLIPAATQAPTFTPVSVAPVSVACDKHGTVAWQNDNQLDGQAYGEAPVGGLDEVCGVVGQTHWYETDADGKSIHVRAVFYVQPHMVAWLSGHLGGTGWYFGGTRAEIEANLAEQAQQLLERDGEMKTYVIILPEDTDSFPILTRVQTKP